MEPGKGSGGEAYQDTVGRSRFRLSFTVAVLQLAVAVAGVGVAVLIAGQGGGPTSRQQTTHESSQTANAAVRDSSTRSAGRPSTARASSDPRTVTRPSGQPGPTGSGESVSSGVYGAAWPAGFSGYTVALASDIIRSDAVGAVAKARTGGLGVVGVLRSDRYASLRPGYWFVFSGIYATAEEARRQVSTAVDAGFSDAYVRRVAE
jgi:hypothetical protein